MTQTIYWSNLTKMSGIDLAPKHLLLDISQSQSNNKGENFVACPAIRSKHANTFVTHVPYDLNVKFLNDDVFSSDTKVAKRRGLYDNSYAFDWNIERIFFSPIKQIMEVSPAFLHKTSYTNYGHAPSANFDINQWFRPSSPTFQLWPNQDQFLAKKGEAHLYFNFPNSERIVLQEFSMNEKLYEIMEYCLSYKIVKPNTSLNNLYKDFKEKKLDSMVIEEIKKNLRSPEF